MGFFKKAFAVANPITYASAVAGKKGARKFLGVGSNGQPMYSNNTPRPEAQKWDSQLNEDGTLKDNQQLSNNVDSRYLDQMRDDNLRAPGEASAWRGLADQDITRQAGDSQQQLAGAQQQGLDQAAMRGGVSSGARERMMGAGVGQNLANQQNIFGNRLQADMQDEQMRVQGLQNLGQAETSDRKSVV